MAEHRQRHQQPEDPRQQHQRQQHRHDHSPTEHRRAVTPEKAQAGAGRGEEVDLAVDQHRQTAHGKGQEHIGDHCAHRAAERQIKGSSRAKKEALIAGDWERVSKLARNRQGD
ncbi:hypothetical protein [Aurantiacibacter suaedae]|uniref:hypothetical protein n=1 Tax=Aurantiacibacter suaedae TaxID=2545755 RepID=UPI001F500FEB|nr:hypothetical protein [Aurantiacibacter suaedae]